MDIGAFILGILFGWLAEWLYVTFFSSKGTPTGDCTAFERELKTRNEEIKSLKSQLVGADKGAASLLSASNKSKATVSSASSQSQTNKKIARPATKSSAENKTPTKELPAKKTDSKQSAGTAKAATTKKKVVSAKKNPSMKKSSAVKKTTTAKSKTKTVKPKASTKKNTATAANAGKTTEKKSVAAKPVTKETKTVKPTAIKKKPAANKITLKKDIKLNNPTGDDLTKLSGIGPSMAETLGELGITSYKKLAAMDDDILRDMLEASGARLNNNKDAMDSWNEQATMADKGDFVGLKKLQDSLKS